MAEGTNDNILQRTEPQNVEAEKSVIGSMLMDKDAVEAALGILLNVLLPKEKKEEAK